MAPGYADWCLGVAICRVFGRENSYTGIYDSVLLPARIDVLLRTRMVGGQAFNVGTPL